MTEVSNPLFKITSLNTDVQLIFTLFAAHLTCHVLKLFLTQFKSYCYLLLFFLLWLRRKIKFKNAPYKICKKTFVEALIYEIQKQAI